jgi:hypothetical protein
MEKGGTGHFEKETCGSYRDYFVVVNIGFMLFQWLWQQ